MHEWALAEAVLSAAIEEAQKQKIKRLTKITIGIGELQQIEQDIFNFALEEIIKSQNDFLKKVKFSIKNEKSTLKCNSCNYIWSFKDVVKKLNEDDAESIHFIPEVAFVHTRCPKCNSLDFEINSGRGVSIISIEGEK
ncbi:MAG: hydrogenase nickel incorporation protein HypA [Candidatus Thermoplasmatota archaeon]|nr:hydrogenase nickel incorporation protein HypA [Candidatus Thermoplasmatota archaeon]